MGKTLTAAWAALTILGTTLATASVQASSFERFFWQRSPWAAWTGDQLAGADEGDKATKKQLKGQEMVPADNLRKEQPKPAVKAAPEPAPKPEMKKEMKQAEPAPQPAPKPAEAPKPAAAKEPAKPAEPAKPKMADKPAMAGIYVRLDAGYGITNNPDGTQAAGATSAEDVSNFVLIGGGVGYRFTENLRADTTFTFRPKTDVSSTSAASNTNTSEVEALTVMLNGYYDIGTFSGVTPYVGAGIGYSRTSTDDQQTTGGVASEAEATANNFAYAVMTGIAVDVIEKTQATLGYRFINLGEFKQAGATEYDDLLVHEIRAGLRHQF